MVPCAVCDGVFVCVRVREIENGEMHDTPLRSIYTMYSLHILFYRCSMQLSFDSSVGRAVDCSGADIHRSLVRIRLEGSLFCSHIHVHTVHLYTGTVWSILYTPFAWYNNTEWRYTHRTLIRTSWYIFSTNPLGSYTYIQSERLCVGEPE